MESKKYCPILMDIRSTKIKLEILEFRIFVYISIFSDLKIFTVISDLLDLKIKDLKFKSKIQKN
jgi:hypothetical protein